MSKRAKRIDANQPEIVEALRAVGASVYPTHFVGRGFPDLCVGYRGVNYFMELKSDKGELTQDEIDFVKSWRGRYLIIRSIDEALRAIGAIE